MIKLKRRTAVDLEPWTWFVDTCDRECLVTRRLTGEKNVMIHDYGKNYTVVCDPSIITVKTVFSARNASISTFPKYASDLKPGTWFLDNREALCCVLKDEYFGRGSTRRQRVMTVTDSSILKIEYALSSQICVKRIVDPSELEFV